MTGTEHLSMDQVRAYVRGALHPSTLVATDDHLETCASCRAALARESDASFGAEAFGRALAAPEARVETPHLAFEHLRGALEGTLGPVDTEWAEAHLLLCAMCADELQDLSRFASALPARRQPPPSSAPVATPVPAAPSSHATLNSPYGDADARPPARVRPDVTGSDEPPFGYGHTPPARVPLWLKVAVGVSLLAIVQLWAC
jgi:hypothetical protein